jgi:hypothetical protein
VVVDTGKNEKAPIILGRPFLCTTKAIIYAEHSKIIFTIKDKKEKFSFKDRMLHTPAQPHAPSKRNEPRRRRIPEAGGRTRLARHKKRLPRLST